MEILIGILTLIILSIIGAYVIVGVLILVEDIIRSRKIDKKEKQWKEKKEKEEQSLSSFSKNELEAGVNLITKNERQLQLLLPMNKVITSEKAIKVWKDGVIGLHAVSYFRNSPLNNSGVEVVFGKFMTTAAIQKQWAGFDSQWTEYQWEEFQNGRKGLSSMNSFGHALDQAIKENFLSMEKWNDRYYIFPKKNFIDFAIFAKNRIQKNEKLAAKDEGGVLPL
tara:strand:+ start:3833 stop:4501 length:669 start_codon:yes stop_codon:yes gene_type:complete